MNTKRGFLPVEVSPTTIRNIWNSLDMNRKIEDGVVTIELQPRYLARPLTQVFKVVLPNGWIMGVAHRWRNNPADKWSIPDPKRIWIDEVAIFCH